jgi:hypothetical protein
MLFDVNNIFFHTGSVYAFTAGEYVSVSGATSASTVLNGTVINMGVKQDMGIGDGEFIPKIAVYVGTGITSACSSMRINAQLQGSTDSSTWTTYAESGTLTTASFTASQKVLAMNLPRRPVGVALPQYYRLNLAVTGTASNEAISAGTLIGGLVIQRDDNADTLGQYPANFTVA